MLPLDYEAQPAGGKPHTIEWAVGCFFAGCVVSWTLGTLVALLVAPTDAMADAPPVMVVCPAPLSAAFLTALVYVCARLLRWARGGVIVSRGTSMALSVGALAGLLYAGTLYLPEPSAAIGALVTLVVLPFAFALLITRSWTAGTGHAPPR